LDTSKGTNFGLAWQYCSSLVCMQGVNTLNATNTNFMFNNTPALQRPDADERAQILAKSNWVSDVPYGTDCTP
jgi:hypothetical protein